MSNSNDSKHDILKRLGFIANDQEKRTFDIPYQEIFPGIDDVYSSFKENFEKLNGTFVQVQNIDEIVAHLNLLFTERKLQHILCFVPELCEQLIANVTDSAEQIQPLDRLEAAITNCEALVARTGSIFISSNSLAGRKFNILPDLHIVIAYKSQLFTEIDEGLNYLKQKYNRQFPSMISLVSGPSRTADIEKTLVMGAHGPKEILLFLINN